MDDSAPPPTHHVLRPHHIAILIVLLFAIKDIETGCLAPAFALHIYRVLLNEIAEVAPPTIWSQLLQDLSSGNMAEALEGPRFLATIRRVNDDLSTPEQLSSLLGTVPSLFMGGSKMFEQDVPALVLRRTIFGHFCRRCFVSFLKLSFAGVVKLHKDYLAWCRGDFNAGYETVDRDKLSNDLLIFRTQTDKKSWAQPESYEAWEKGLAIGDENIAAENLHRFFEQHFHENNDSGIRQHALLNLVRMHYLRREFVAARKLLSEAITVARTAGDRITLQHCISMLHRLPTEPGEKPPLNEIQPDLHPLEVLADVRKFLDVQNDQPLSLAFMKVIQAVGVYDHWVDSQIAAIPGADQWAQYAVQSVIWDAAGCGSLAAIMESVVIAFTDVAGDDNNRLTSFLNSAYRLARAGMYERALMTIMKPEVWKGLAMHDYAIWAGQVWHILVLRASRRGQERLYRNVLRPRRPPGDFRPRDYFFESSCSRYSKIRDPFFEVIQMRQCGQAASVIEQLLTALWHSEFQGRMHAYRLGIMLLADIGLEFGMAQRSRIILEEIMPQVITGTDTELTALACVTLARCIIAEGDSSAILQAVSYLRDAETNYRALECLNSLADVQYLLSVTYHNLGDVKRRDEAAKCHLDTQNERARLESVTSDEDVDAILQAVAEVGAALAAR